ncbi:MAG: 2-C-methyl-D-erythritol 4-phosphate cytidylyltransferase, partial [Candidatus Methylopumilus sp.]
MATVLPKQYLPLLGRPMIAWTLDTFLACERIASVQLVLSADD